MASMTLPALGPALPEIVLAIGAIAMVLYGAIRGEGATRVLEGAALALLALALVLVLSANGKAVTFNGAFVADGFARFMKVLTLIGAGAAIILAGDFMRRDGSMRFEFPVLVVLATIGMMMMISANDLIGLYVGLELQSLALYVVAAFDRDNAKSTEAGLKYFVLGALSSGMLLYGASLVYGFTGTVSYSGIAQAVQGGHAGLGLIFGIVFVAAGVAFKISAVPFHMWTPDVYEGAPTPVAAFFASAPKMAAMAMMVRIFVGAFPGALHDWQQIIVFMAIASMALGAFAAIGQSNIKRLLAYSSIANMGYALVGLAAGTASRGPGRDDLYGDLSRHHARRLRLRADDAARRQAGRGDRRARRPVAHQSLDGLRALDDDVLARRHPAARRLLGEVLRLPRRDRRQALRARRGRRRHQRRRRLLLPAPRQGDVFRRRQARLRKGRYRRARPCCWSRPCSCWCSRCCRRRSSTRPLPRRSRCSDAPPSAGEAKRRPENLRTRRCSGQARA
jgi:hypothetical protein